MCRLFTVAAVLLIFCSPAHAWWEYAKWGMTGPQLVVASKNAVKACDADSLKCRPYFRDYTPIYSAESVSAAGRKADAQFVFDVNGKLAATYLRFLPPGEGTLNTLIDALTAKYGPPISGTDEWPPRRLWRDTARGTSIQLWGLDPTGVVVVYRPTDNGL